MLLDWVGGSLLHSSENEGRMLLATLLLQNLLRVKCFRTRFFAHDDFVKELISITLISRNVQAQYQSIFAIWLLSFDLTMARELQTQHGIITALLDVAKAAIKEKVLRICISTWRNLLVKAPNISVPVMIGARVVDFLDSLSDGRLTDEESLSDVALLREELCRAIQNLNSFDEYSSEIISGILDWSPPHKSELFWRDNAARLADDDLHILRRLIDLLDPTTNDPKIVAIAAHDIGMYIEHHSSGRANLDKIAGKQKIMALITFQDPEVRFQALSTMQKYMKKLWNPT